MEVLIPREKLLEQIRPCYPVLVRGKVPYPLKWMLRVHCVQLFYNVGDPGMEDMLHEIESVGRFKGTVWMPASLRRQHRGRTGKENMIPR